MNTLPFAVNITAKTCFDELISCIHLENSSKNLCVGIGMITLKWNGLFVDTRQISKYKEWIQRKIRINGCTYTRLKVFPFGRFRATSTIEFVNHLQEIDVNVGNVRVWSVMLKN